MFIFQSSLNYYLHYIVLLKELGGAHVLMLRAVEWGYLPPKLDCSCPCGGCSGWLCLLGVINSLCLGLMTDDGDLLAKAADDGCGWVCIHRSIGIKSPVDGTMYIYKGVGKTDP
jgi:hypothetical protein